MRLRIFSRLRLRHKLTLVVSLAALLPLVIASSVATRIVLRNLERGLTEQTERQLGIAMNLVLRNVERLGGETADLASVPALVEAIGVGEATVTELLAREEPRLASALVQVADARGRVLAVRPMGGDDARFAGLAVESGSAVIGRGLAYERRVNLVTVGDRLVVRAVAPVVDPSFSLRGVVVMSLPLDGDFADGIKGALGADVLIHAGAQAAMSSFIERTGARMAGITAPTSVAVDVLAGGTRITRGTIDGREYALGYAPLKNLEGEHVGMLAVAVGRDSLVAAQTAATRSIAFGAAGAFLFALLIAGILSGRLTGPIGRLHEGALAVARGNLGVRLRPIEPGDEIGDLAAAFTTMTASLRENQERLAARMREIVALHEAGRAVSSVLGLDEVLHKIVDSVVRVLDARLAVLWLVETPLPDGEPQLRVGAARSGELGDPTPEGTPVAEVAPEGTPVAEVRPEGTPVAEVRPEGTPVAEAAPEGTPVAEAAPEGTPVARLRPESTSVAEAEGRGGKAADALVDLAAEAVRAHAAVRIEHVETDQRWRSLVRTAGASGTLLAVPLERKDHVVGVIVVGRLVSQSVFTDAEENLVGAFADTAAAAIENARLYEEVRAFSEDLEEKVKLRTRELTAMNAELGRALAELRETQAQLVLSERLAGLGSLVAGVAHEINSPSAAIRGAADALGENVRRLARSARELGELGLAEDERSGFLSLVELLAPTLATQRVASPAEVRRRTRELTAKLGAAGVEAAETCARTLVEIGADQALEQLGPIITDHPAPIFVGYLREYTYLHRNAAAIGAAIKQIQRIVGALKMYSHLDQANVETADLHEGIENTLVILHHELKYGISIVRRYGELPKVPVFVDELNQVWTNLIHNAVQALGGKGEIVIETSPPTPESDMVTVRVVDNGPGIPPDVMPRIFEPFFTTKAKGEGTGLGLGIVRRILDKHHGAIEVESAPGRTCFAVRLPLNGPAGELAAGSTATCGQASGGTTPKAGEG